MRKVLLIVASLLILSPNIFAQQDPNDPGIQDSIIIDSIFVNVGEYTSADVHVYVVTDDSVAFYQMALAWESPNNSIRPRSVWYWGDLLYWDINYDSVIMDDSYMRIFGFSDTGGQDNCFLDTHGQRMLGWTIHFIIDEGAPIQQVPIDTTYDDRLGHMMFGLADGVTGFTPAVVPGNIYNGYILGIKDDNPKPDQFALAQNYPNPFNASTEIIFDMPSAQNVNLSIYNLLGQQVAVLVDDFKQPGRYSVNWHGTDMNGDTAPSGVYFYRLSTSDNVQTRKMIMMK